MIWQALVWLRSRKELSKRALKIFLQLFFNSSKDLSCLEEFGKFRLAWQIIVEENYVEELWKHLVNAIPGGLV
jgi:hypothetical protein